MATIQKTFHANQSIFKEGEPSTCLFVIKKGTVSVRKMKGSSFIEVAKVYSNEVLGELSFFDRRPRSATAVALTEVDALEIDFYSLDKSYLNIPDYFKTIIASLADRLRKSNDLVRRLQKNMVPEETQAEENTSEKPEGKAEDKIVEGPIPEAAAKEIITEKAPDQAAPASSTPPPVTDEKKVAAAPDVPGNSTKMRLD